MRFDTLESQEGVAAAFLVRPDGGRDDALRELDIAPGRMVQCEQVHGDHVAVVRREDLGENATSVHTVGEADGLATGERGVALTIRVADCVPVYLVSPGCIALVHAGRRGARLRIAEKAARVMTGGCGVRPSEIRALIGPSAGPCCYEVSAAMAAEWSEAGLPARGRRLDLWEANRRQLVTAGVADDRIEVTGECTICSGRYYSYRRGDKGGRNVAVLLRR